MWLSNRTPGSPFGLTYQILVMPNVRVRMLDSKKSEH
jgi:hypothetical protein